MSAMLGKVAMGALKKGGASQMMATAAKGQMGAASKFMKKNPKAMEAFKTVGKETVARAAGGHGMKQAFVTSAAGAAGIKPIPAPAAPAAPVAQSSGTAQEAAIGRAIMAASRAKGGIIRKGGRYYLHKGEKVVAKRSVPKVTKAMQKDGMRVRHKGEAAVKKVPFVPLSKLRKMGNGGTVLKTGLHVLKAGQRVIPASKVAKAKKAIKKA